MRFVMISLAAWAVLLGLHLYDPYDGKQPDAYKRVVSNYCNAERTKQWFTIELMNGEHETYVFDNCLIKELT